jgi:ABC-type sugar transport system ATPase subunit
MSVASLSSAERPRAAPATSGSEGPAASGVRLQGVSKSFGATRALVDVDLEFASGRTYVLAGENGSGKSTMIKILAGVLPPDRGTVMICGKRVRRFSPRAALDAGVATCFQEVLVEGNLSVLENIYLWDKGWLRAATSRRERASAAASLLRELSANELELSRPVEELSLAERQLVVIARALALGSPVLLLDEPTAALDQRDSERALSTFESKAKGGRVVVLTSHRLEEIERAADEVVVLRNGRVAGHLDRSEVTEARLLHLMSGTQQVTRAAGGVSSAERRVDKGDRQREVRLRIRGGQLRPSSPPFDLEIFAGEVTGFAGLEGHGQAELLEVLAGRRQAARGEVEVATPDGFRPIDSYRKAVRAGVVYVPRDRKTQGIFPTLSVLDNVGIATEAQRSKLGFSRRSRARRELEPLTRALAVRAASLRVVISSLSGGNQQKVLLARWLATRPKVILLDDPTRGVDLKTKQDLYAILRDQADAGSAVVLVSTELEELTSLCDRVIVIHRFSCSADLRPGSDGSRISRQAVLAAMFGYGSQV